MKPILRAAFALGGALILSVAFAGVLFTACNSSHFSFSSGGFTEHAERTDVLELHLSSGSSLQAQTPYGAIHVRTAVGGTGSVHAVVKAFGKTTADAQGRLDRTRIVVTENASGTALAIQFEPEMSVVSGEPTPNVDYEIAVPAGVKLDLNSDSGNLTAEVGPFGGSRLSSSYGNVRIENVNGDTTIHSSSGNLSVAGQSGGSLDAHTDYGNVSLSDIDASTVRARTSSGNVKANSVRAATIGLESDYGNINVQSTAGNLTVRTSSGDICIKEIEAELSARTDYGRVEIDGVLKRLQAHSSSGDVRVRARAGSAVESDWKIDSDYGSVSLQALGNLPFDLAARTDYGDVNVGYAIEVPPGSTTKKGSVMRGKVNGGGSLVTIRSSSGTVSVKPLDP